ncbi:hypothetical protein [Chryseobacterium oncorhynchi]|uniref:Uncharacterized protein n=1 Tax=Chryseobacterium oncorhynchi TaxID=741074 RepID=A0A316WSA0_9FLAO|nr:hypothetical protein [Chryseobacterium oncorhynchi]PWN62078.1 hypothetical protein C1638_016325 [Chryseobacterium oncorhynchi]
MYKRNIINFLAIFLFCLYSAQAKEVCCISSYNGKTLSVTNRYQTNYNFTSYSFLKPGKIMSASQHDITLIYDTYREEISPHSQSFAKGTDVRLWNITEALLKVL